MSAPGWSTPHWPDGVPREVSGYERPLFSTLDETARDFPDQVYTVFNDAPRTYAQVKDAADRVANFLAGRGIRKGDRVAIFLPNLPHYPPIFFGILKAGAVGVTCNPLYKAQELQHQLKDCGARALFCMDHPGFYPTAVKAIEGTSVETVVICGVKSYLPKLKGIIGGLLGKIPKAGSYQPGHLFFDDVPKAAQPEPPELSIDPSTDLALILYTGGTRGIPKGACLTHVNFTYDLACARIVVSSYNEPLITAEWAVAVFQQAKGAGLACAFVSKGNATPEVLDFLRPWIVAYKIDLKGFNDKNYRTLGGTLEHVTEGIRMVHQRGHWLEVVTLVVPGFNDSESELRQIAQFLASISRDLPWHVTAFHQDYKLTDRPNTTAAQLMRAAEIGTEEGLRFVYAGNAPGRDRRRRCRPAPR